MNIKRKQAIIQNFAGKRLVALGDLMLDEYLWGKATRISPESPVMVVEIERESSVPGGAANVVNNLLALGAIVHVVGVVGDDEAGLTLKTQLQERGASVDGVVTDSSRPTTRKTRIVAHNQQVLRVDREKVQSLDPEIEELLIRTATKLIEGADAVIVSDYNKGVLTSVLAKAVVHAAKTAGIIITANPKPVTARRLAGATVLSLNQSEAEMTSALGAGRDRPLIFSGEGLDDAGAQLRCELGVDTLLVTRGGKGLSLWQEGLPPMHVPAHEVEVYDVAGAGDTVISALTLAMAAGADLVEAAIIANHAAACVVRKVGVATVTTGELLKD